MPAAGEGGNQGQQQRREGNQGQQQRREGNQGQQQCREGNQGKRDLAEGRERVAGWQQEDLGTHLLDHWGMAERMDSLLQGERRG